MKQYKNTVNTSTHITISSTQLSKHPHITKPIHIQTDLSELHLTCYNNICHSLHKLCKNSLPYTLYIYIFFFTQQIVF